MSRPDRTAHVWEALAGVLDPELDESVVTLGFVTHVGVDGDRAAVAFRLPTFWCSANFAWIMAEDMQAALGRLAWLSAADVRLVDHFAADRVNEGVAAGRSFAEAFGGEASGDLTALRETFRRKAYLGRMSRLIEALRAGGWDDAGILGASVAGLGAARTGPALAVLVARFLELRSRYGGSAAPADPAFRLADGGEIAPGRLAAVLRDIRMIRRSSEANGEMCRALLRARMEVPAPAEAPVSPPERVSSET